ncbi:MAG: hypothetical protein RLZZ397_301 [Pseudomonadota bacterium]
MMIRLSTPEDASSIWHLIEQELDEMGAETRQAFDAQRVWHHLQALWRDRPDTHRLWVALTHQGSVVGILLGTLQAYYWRSGHQAQVVHWYVRPDSRGSSAAMRLLLAYMAWAQQKHSQEIMVGITSGIAPEKSHRLLARLGFVCMGRNYLRSGLCKSH